MIDKIFRNLLPDNYVSRDYQDTLKIIKDMQRSKIIKKYIKESNANIDFELPDNLLDINPEEILNIMIKLKTTKKLIDDLNKKTSSNDESSSSSSSNDYF